MKIDVATLDQLQDISECLERIEELANERAASEKTMVVDVKLPEMPAPVVNIEPNICVEAPAKAVQKWTFRVTERSINGDIIEFTATSK